MSVLNGFCRIVLLALLDAVLGVAVASKSNVQLNHASQLSSTDRHMQTALRGRVPDQRHHQRAVIALQASQSSHLQVGKSRAARTNRRLVHTARSAKLKQLLHIQDEMTRGQVHAAIEVGICRGNKLKWWIKIKRKCSKSYGADSKWDQTKLGGQCKDAWKKCNTGFYAVCCTQPIGAKTLDAFCEKKKLGLDADGKSQDDDKACEVQEKVQAVHSIVEGIKDTVKLMDEEEIDAPVQAVIHFDPMISAGPSPGPASVVSFAGPAAAVAPPGITGSVLKNKVEVTTPAPAPAPARAAIVLGPKEHKPSKLETNCEKLSALTLQAVEKIGAIKAWAGQNAIRHVDDGATKHVTGEQEFENDIGNEIATANPENPEAKDPDLVFSLQGVLKMGSKLDSLLKLGKFCSMPASEEDEDEDDDPIEDDLHKDPTKAWASDEEEKREEYEEEEDDEELKRSSTEVVKVNETLVFGLLEWETDMNEAVTKFETKVHPHGYKWWRYRYEYTVVESVVLSFSVMVLYVTMWVLHGVKFSQEHKFYKTGLPQRFYRYAWVYFVFHGAALMMMVTTAYILYTPWGEHNIFNAFAKVVYGWAGDSLNVPFIGYSWLYMVLDVQMQLFATFTLYTVFMVMVCSNYVSALREWRNLADVNPEDIPNQNRSVNVELYVHLHDVLSRRVANSPKYRQIFNDLKLRLPGVEGHDQPMPGWHDFKLHLYLTEGLGRSAEHLVEVSLTTNIFLAGSTLIVAFLAHYYQVAFMYFLPGFVAIGLLFFIVGYGTSVYLRRISLNEDHNDELRGVTHHSFCRAVQILLYCLFFSFSRLLLSNDIFEDYAVIYFSGVIGLIVVLCLLGIFAGEVLKATALALMLPPHVPKEMLHKYAKHVLLWHTKEKCHECGIQQHPANQSLSKEWAGSKSTGSRSPLPLDTARQYSWRG